MTRNDWEIRRDIEAELQWSPDIDDKKIGVIVDAGVVTLTGEVEHRAGRCAAEQITQRITGVRAIANEIQVKLALAGVHSDPEIALAAAEHVLRNIAGVRMIVNDLDVGPALGNLRLDRNQGIDSHAPSSG